jgi:putative inorganic carbon (HCO3(-)) transporter
MLERTEMRNNPASPSSFQVFLQRIFLHEKLNNGLGISIVVFIAIALGYLISNNFVLGVGVFAAIIGVCIALVCILSSEAGLYINMLYAFSVSGISRFLFNDDLPVGVISEILIYTTFVGLFISNENLKRNSTLFFRCRPIILYSVILGYLTLELFNPLGHSFQGWLQVMRKVFDSFVIVFIAYNVFDRMSRIRRFINVLFYFALTTALYGCFQQWHGLLPQELYWVNSNPLRLGLIYVFGDYRKFSMLGGPTDLGIIMAACSLFFIIISLNEKRRLTKIKYAVGCIFMLLAMSYSGTRTANAMFIGGVGVFLLLTINKWSSKVFAFFALMLFLFLMYVPIYSSITLIRFRTTFSASEDASFNVREINRQSVQPFLRSHPFGAGLSTTGQMGTTYNPGSPVAGFPTDSSYLNKALESGWVGLILTCILYFAILQHIVRGYFQTTDEKLRSFFAASLAFFFSYFLGEITQEAVGVFVNMLIYFPVLAIILRLRQFADEQQGQSLSTQLW